MLSFGDGGCYYLSALTPHSSRNHGVEGGRSDVREDEDALLASDVCAASAVPLRKNNASPGTNLFLS